MSPQTVISTCLFGVFCLAPLALYLTWLATINRRPRPTVINGGWDFAILTAGLSGFLVFGGGIVLAGLQSNARLAVRGNWEQIQSTWGEEKYAWGGISLGYFLIVCGVIMLATIARRRTLCVYNVGRLEAEAVVEGAIAAAGVVATRFGNLWSDGRGLVALTDVPGFRHVSLKLVCPDPRLAEEIERNLRLRFDQLSAPPTNPAGGWFFSAATGSLMVMLCFLFAIGYLVYFAR